MAHPGCWRAIWAYSTKRAVRDNQTLIQQRNRAIDIINGEKAVKKARFVKTGLSRRFTLDEDAYQRAVSLIGLKGYVTNIPTETMPANEVIGCYHDLWHVEQSFRMSKTDLAARPIFHRTRDAIEAHLTIVFAALAIARGLQQRTRVSLKNHPLNRPRFRAGPFWGRRVGIMPKKIDPAVKARALRLVKEHRGQYSSLTAVCQVVARQERIGAETLRRWVQQAEIDEGVREGVTSQELEQIRKLKAENPRLREDVAILKAATVFFAGGVSTPAIVDHLVHQRDASAGVRGRIGVSGPAGAGLSDRCANLPGMADPATLGQGGQ